MPKVAATYSDCPVARRDPGAAWAMLTIDGDADPVAELHRVTYDADAVAMEVSDRGLPGDVYRAATIRKGRLMR